ncbi:MAG TPA: HD domain-containing phosphohydrolase [Vicinamibacteria bacterium]|jgi:putative nucleotidyltransferase with HDIG domain
MFTLFVLCSLAPITVLAVLSFTHVTGQLNEQSQSRLRQASKALGMAVVERLMFLEANLTTVAATLELGSWSEEKGGGSVAVTRDLGGRFKRLGIMSSSGEYRVLLGEPREPIGLTADQRAEIPSGRSLLLRERITNGAVALFMVRAVNPENVESGLLLGELDPGYLWGGDSSLPPLTELCILDHKNLVLFCSGEPTISTEVALRAGQSASGRLEWNWEDQEYLAGHWTIPLFAFSSDEWKVFLSESKADVLAPMANFRRTFPLVLLMSIWVVLLLSVRQIRRSLVPLEKLREGTRRLAKRDFSSHVVVESGDEFEELAASFNTMAGQLGKQFHALSTMAEIDRAILSVLDTRQIVNTVLTRMPDIYPCRLVSVALFDPKKKTQAEVHTRKTNPDDDAVVETIEVETDQLEKLQGLRAHPDKPWTEQSEPPYLLPRSLRRGVESWLVFPIPFHGGLGGIMVLGDVGGTNHQEEDLQRARQLVDQVAVALANATLIEQLDELNWGTLVALARTIDAKSPWTLGHSERAAEMALKIGRILGLSRTELDNLHRGALLHDIGKIGIPPTILDKPGKLTPEETAVMREHTLIGERILQPIAAYAEVIPVVSQHHEWFDGSGYPRNLRGGEISFIARIYAVADVFDALVADRPYRGGLAIDTVIEYIEERAGKQFDPSVVEAFLEIARRDRTHLEKQYAGPTPLGSLLPS